MINDLELLQDFEILRRRPIVLWGASTKGMQTCLWLREIGIEIRYFADSDLMKWHDDVNGICVLSPIELKEYCEREDIAIIITSWYYQEIRTAIEKLQLRCKHIYSHKVFAWGLHRYFKQMEPECSGLSSYGFLKQSLENVTMAEYYNHFTYRNFLDKLCKNPVLVYQPGKVGSTTICHTLAVRNIPCVHVHNFKTMSEDPIVNLWPASQTIKIISCVREPIARDLSSYFEAMDSAGYYFSNAYCPNFLEEVIQVMNTSYRSFMFGWFQEEFYPMTGIDVYEYPFDREKGYSIIKHNNVELLLMKAERLNDLEKVIGDFVGVDDFHLDKNWNVGAEKETNVAYQQTKAAIRLPMDYVEHYYKNNPQMDHFYTESEKKEFLQKWEKNICSRGAMNSNRTIFRIYPYKNWKQGKV